MPISLPHRVEPRSQDKGRRRLPRDLSGLLGAVHVGRGPGTAQRESFYRELHLLLNAGVDPRTVLDLLIKAQGGSSIRPHLQKVRDAVVNGRSLSDALQGAGVFSPYEVHSVRIGEESGRLAEVCLQLAEHHADRIKLQRMLRQAIAYPAFVLVITLAVVFFMLQVVVPMFAQVFARSGAELPALTRYVLRISTLSAQWWPWLVPVLGVILLAVFRLRKDVAWRTRWEWIVFRVPVLGPLVRKALLARHCRAMAFLLEAGTPLDRALELCTAMTASPRFHKALQQIRTEVVQGGGLASSMERHDLFEPSMLAMLSVAEEVKQLDAMHRRLSERYSADVQHGTALLGSVLEPATILIIALLVGVVLVAMYLPMFKLSTTF